MARVCTRSAAFTRARSPFTLDDHSTALVIDALISPSFTWMSVLPGAAWRDTHAGHARRDDALAVPDDPDRGLQDTGAGGLELDLAAGRPLGRGGVGAGSSLAAHQHANRHSSILDSDNYRLKYRSLLNAVLNLFTNKTLRSLHCSEVRRQVSAPGGCSWTDGTR